MPDIPFSKKYLNELKTLYTEYEEKRITADELSRRIDEIREREILSHEPMGRVLLMQKLEEAEKEIEREVNEEFQRARKEAESKERADKARENYQAQKDIQDQLAKDREEQKKKMKREKERNDYRDEIGNYINRLESNAQSWQWRYTVLQIILLLFSAATATMASMDVIPRPLVSLTGFIATVAGGLLTTFKIQDRIYASRKAVAEARLECQKYDRGIEEYKDLDEESAFMRLSRRMTSIQSEQMLQEVELWKPQKDQKKEEIVAQNVVSKGQEDKEADVIVDKETQEKKPSDDTSKEQLNKATKE